LFAVITRGGGDKAAKIRRLIDLGADMNDRFSGGTPVMQAVTWFGQFKLALMMLEAGADHRTYQHNEYRQLIHVVAGQERRLHEYTPEQRAGFHELVKWLEDHGESYEAAKADIARWDSWFFGEFRGTGGSFGECRHRKLRGWTHSRRTMPGFWASTTPGESMLLTFGSMSGESKSAWHTLVRAFAARNVANPAALRITRKNAAGGTSTRCNSRRSWSPVCLDAAARTTG
jgi:hypothetical protein